VSVRGDIAREILRIAGAPTNLLDDELKIRRPIAIKYGLRLAGWPEDLVDNNGDPNQDRILKWVLTNVEVRSAVAPPIVYDPRKPPVPSPAATLAGVAVAFVKPQVIIRTRFGTKTYAPAGVPNSRAWETFAVGLKKGLIVAGGVGVGATAAIGAGLYFLGKRAGRRVA